MDALHYLYDLIIIFALAWVVSLVFQALRAPLVVGFLVAGVVVGPHGLSLVRDDERVAVLAEVGIVVLLFTIGLEFSLSRLRELAPLMLKVGLVQVLVCGLAVAAWCAAGWAPGDLNRWAPGILLGMLVAMSSTAVVLKMLNDRGELTAPHGQVALAVLLFQDLLVPVCVLSLPLLASGEGAGWSLWLSLARGVAIVALYLLGARYLLPPLFNWVVRTGNREVFLLTIVMLALGTAGLTAWAGLSLALGAFLAGLALSESEYAHQTLAEVLPFRDTLASLFFVSVGMLLNPGAVARFGPEVAGTVVAVLALKFLAVSFPALLAGFPLRVAVLSGLALAQMGEFSLLLANQGLKLELLSADDYQIFLAGAVLTIMLTPGMLAGGRLLGRWLPSRGIWGGRIPELAEPDGQLGDEPTRDHVVVLGYGEVGRNLARVLRDVDVPYVALDLNPEAVRQARRQGEPVHYGDGTRTAVLEMAGLPKARLFVVATSNAATARLAVHTARQMNPGIFIVVHTRYLGEVEALRDLGADVIVPERFETIVEIFSRVLGKYEVPRNLILDVIDRIRTEHYEVLRDPTLPATRLELPLDFLSTVDVHTCQIRGDSAAAGQTLAGLQLRTATGATLLAVRRKGRLLTNPGPDFRLEAGDVAVLIGDRPQLDRALLHLDPGLELRKPPGPGDGVQST